MRAVVVVVVSPCADQLAGMAQAGEQVFVQAFVPEPSVEAFDQAVLHRFSRSDVVPLDTAFFLPAQDSVRREFRPVAYREMSD